MTSLDVIRLFIRKVDFIIAEFFHDGTGLQYSKFFLPTNAHFIKHKKMLKLTIKISLYSLLHVSAHPDHPQGA
jgi:hypothetical protein